MSISLKLSDIEAILDKKLVNFKRQITDENELLAKRIKICDNFEFKKKGNKLQHKFNCEVLSKVESASKALSEAIDTEEDLPEEIAKANKDLAEGIELLLQRNKLIKLADQSDAGWAIVTQYQTNEVADDDEDDRKIRRAETAAVRQVASRRRQHTWRRYGRGRGYYYNSNFASNSFPALGSRGGLRGPWQNRKPSPFDRCFACGDIGHWRDACPKWSIPRAPANTAVSNHKST